MLLAQKSDLLGSLASFLCLIHCLATPFVFAAKACTVNSCCASAPTWWIALDYLFLGISFWSVWHSTKTSNTSWVKVGLWSSWIGVLLVILNEKLQFLPHLGVLAYIPPIGLIVLHLYNQQFCTCSSEYCPSNS